MLQTEQEDLRMFNTLTLFALLIRCPAGNIGEDGNCPFAKLRNSCALEEKFRIAETLPDEKSRELLCIHNSCLSRDSRNHGELRRKISQQNSLSAGHRYCSAG